jgi:two-component system LytT family response regulator
VNKFRALIVDDEPLARERLRSLLQTETSVDLVGECGSGTDAIATIRSIRPDIVFLDVQMPGCDGLQVLAEIPAENRPTVIFVTAYERYALNAFDVHAADYLLKPFDRERFQTALHRAQEQVRTRRVGTADPIAPAKAPESGAAAVPAKRPDRLAFRTDGKVIFLKPDDIVWVEAADNYVVLHLEKNERLILRETMTALELQLGSETFARVNRSALVHLDRIRELEPTFHGDYVVVLRDGTRLPLSRSLRGQLERFTGGPSAR